MTTNLVNMDFEGIKQDLKDFLKNQQEFSDYNFEGSGLNVLLNVLAYAQQQDAYLVNMLANEADIGSAVLRENVVSRAKGIGYTPASRRAARMILSIRIDDPTNLALSLLLPRGTKFLASESGVSFVFVTLRDYNLYLDSETGQYINDEIEVFEGSIKAVSWQVEDAARYIINSTKIDTETLRVGNFASYAVSDGEIFEQSKTITKINGDSAVFWVQETDGRRYEIVFGDGIFGKKPENNTVIYAEYLDTNGPIANGISRVSLAGTFAGYAPNKISITTVNISTGGAEQESTASIKLNAPRARAAMGSVITPEDSAVAIKELYPYAKSVSVWGGDEETPVQFGKVFASVIPIDGGFLTNYTKSEISRKLSKRSVAGISTVIVDPEYIFMNMTAYVRVRRNSVSQLKQFQQSIRDQIIAFFEEEAGQFDNDFSYSNLVTTIETYSRSVDSVNIQYDISSRGLIGVKKTFDFGNPLTPGTIRSNKLLSSMTISAVSLSDRDGVLYLGDHPIGEVIYSSGLITLTDTTLSSSNGAIEIFAEPENFSDIIIRKRNALLLDKNRLVVELEAR